MLADLDYYHLEVVLIPSHDPDCAMRGGKIRVAHEHNAEWYQDFCSEYTARRKRPRRKRLHDTLIKRSNTRRGLLEIINGRCDSIYAQRLRDFIEHRIKCKKVA
jgi:hypothetical protein